MKASSFFWAGFVTVAVTGAVGAAASHDKEMLELAPQTRLEQRCNARAMGIVGREHKGFHPDEFVAYAFGDPAISGNTIEAPGGALRSGGVWYRLSYDCTTTADGLQVQSFHYTLGASIPKAEWAEHYLVP